MMVVYYIIMYVLYMVRDSIRTHEYNKYIMNIAWDEKGNDASVQRYV